MLYQAGETIDPKDAIVTVGEASFPAPFASELEFNSPVHGNWNIVHMGMLVPEAIQIYVCADNCMRGVVLTAAEMNAADRFSFVILEEDHVLNGNLEDITIEGVSDVLNKRKDRPRAVLLFTVCLHHFLGADLKRIYDELEERFPDIYFVRCYMDPIMQKHGLTPDQKLRKAMYDPLSECTADPHTVTLFGGDFVLDETSDIRRLLNRYGYSLRELPACHTWEEYLKLSEGKLFLDIYPAGKYGMETQARRLDREYLYLPGNFDYEETEKQLQQLLKSLGLPELTKAELAKEREDCEAALCRAKEVIQDTPVALDYLFHPRPLGLARLLLTHGFNVEAIYLDGISPEEEQDFHWLQEHAPQLELRATIQVKMRVLPREHEGKILAIGQKAAWFTRSRNFVNMVQGGGLYGFDGIRRVANLMIDAHENEKDTERLVVQKGWGCECCL